MPPLGFEVEAAILDSGISARKYHLSEIRAGMWLEAVFPSKKTSCVLSNLSIAVLWIQLLQGRVSQSVDKGVMVDVGAYTERGEWVDGFLHMGQIKDDGGYVAHVSQLHLHLLGMAESLL